MRLNLRIQDPDASPQALTLREVATLLSDLDRVLVAQARSISEVPEEQLRPRLMGISANLAAIDTNVLIYATAPASGSKGKIFGRQRSIFSKG